MDYGNHGAHGVNVFGKSEMLGCSKTKVPRLQENFVDDDFFLVILRTKWKC